MIRHRFVTPRPQRFHLLACGAVLALMTLPLLLDAPANGSAALRSNAGVQAEELSDDGVIAAALGMTEAEAHQQVLWREALGRIDFASLDNGYAGVSSEATPKFAIDYYSTGEDMRAVQSALKMAGLLDMTRFHQTSFTSADLDEAQVDVKNAMTSVDLTGDIRRDFAWGKIEVSVTFNPSEEASAAVAKASSVPVDWKIVDSLWEEEVGGGWGMDNSCTGGFVVVEFGTGNRGISTAGHCDAATLYNNNVNIHYKLRAKGGSYDVMWEDEDLIDAGTNWQNKVPDSSGTRAITDRKLYANMSVGDWVCKYGNITNFTCGSIDDLTVCPGYIPNCNSKFVEVTRLVTQPFIDLSKKGDSGGPVYYSNTAWGLVSGGTDDHAYMIFMPQGYMENAINVRVAVT